MPLFTHPLTCRVEVSQFANTNSNFESTLHHRSCGLEEMRNIYVLCYHSDITGYFKKYVYKICMETIAKILNIYTLSLFFYDLISQCQNWIWTSAVRRIFHKCCCYGIENSKMKPCQWLNVYFKYMLIPQKFPFIVKQICHV